MTSQLKDLYKKHGVKFTNHINYTHIINQARELTESILRPEKCPKCHLEYVRGIAEMTALSLGFSLDALNDVAKLIGVSLETGKKYYIIKVIQLLPNKELHRKDRDNNPTGEYEYRALSEEEALDHFHGDIPISMPEDFHIDIVRKS